MALLFFLLDAVGQSYPSQKKKKEKKTDLLASTVIVLDPQEDKKKKKDVALRVQKEKRKTRESSPVVTRSRSDLRSLCKTAHSGTQTIEKAKESTRRSANKQEK